MQAVTRKPLPHRDFGLGFVSVQNDRLFLTTFRFAKYGSVSETLLAAYETSGLARNFHAQAEI
jgi:hypothetical protein